MTEKEKAARGLLYNTAHDDKLMDDLRKANRLLFEYNSLNPDKEEVHSQLLHRLLCRVGEGVKIIPPFYCDYGYNIEIGDSLFANMNLVILDGAKVIIGNNVLIAPNVGIYTVGHPLDVSLRRQGLAYAHPVRIGNDVWIGAHVCILPGVTIGDNVVIGAGSVVTSDIPSNVLACGNPCTVVRSIC